MFKINDPETWPVLLNLKNVMAITCIGKSKALALVQSGELPMTKLRGRYVISRDGFLTWLSRYDNKK